MSFSVINTLTEYYLSALLKNRFEVFRSSQTVTNQINHQRRIHDHSSEQELFGGLKMRREEPSGDPVLGNSSIAHAAFVNKIHVQWYATRNYTCRETNTLRHTK